MFVLHGEYVVDVVLLLSFLTVLGMHKYQTSIIIRFFNIWSIYVWNKHVIKKTVYKLYFRQILTPDQVLIEKFGSK